MAYPREIHEWVDEQEYPASGTVIEARIISDWTFVLESSGYQATSFAEQLPEGGDAVVIYRSINADSSFQYA